MISGGAKKQAKKKVNSNEGFWLMDFVKDDGRCVIVAMDHGAAMGAIKGLEDVESAIKKYQMLMVFF